MSISVSKSTFWHTAFVTSFLENSAETCSTFSRRIGVGGPSGIPYSDNSAIEISRTPCLSPSAEATPLPRHSKKTGNNQKNLIEMHSRNNDDPVNSISDLKENTLISTRLSDRERRCNRIEFPEFLTSKQKLQLLRILPIELNTHADLSTCSPTNIEFPVWGILVFSARTPMQSRGQPTLFSA